jgi:hypothetical protein
LSLEEAMYVPRFLFFFFSTFQTSGEFASFLPRGETQILENKALMSEFVSRHVAKKTHVIAS